MSQLYVLQGTTESLKVNQHKFGAQVDCAFGSILSEFCLSSTLMNMFKPSSKVLENFSLPPLPAMSLYSIAKNIFNFENMLPHMYKDADLVDFASFVVEGRNSSQDPSIEAVCGDSVTWLVSALFADH